MRYAALLVILLSGCTSITPSHETKEVNKVNDEFVAPTGSLRYTTLEFSKKYDIKAISYYHTIAPQDDYELRAPRLIVNAKQDRQLALQELYDGSQYIPILNGDELTVYPLTTKYIPLTGADLVRMVRMPVERKKKEPVVKTSPSKTQAATMVAVMPNTSESKKATTAKAHKPATKTAAKGSNKESSAVLVAAKPPQAVSDKTNVKKKDLNTTKKSGSSVNTQDKKNTNVVATKPKSESLVQAKSNSSVALKQQQPTQKKVAIASPKAKEQLHVIYRGQSYRDVLGSWLKRYNVDRVIYDVGPVLSKTLSEEQKNNTSYSVKNEADLLNKIHGDLVSKGPMNSFKIRLIKKPNNVTAVIHQHAFDEVAVFDVKQGSLKENAFALARHYKYVPLEDKNGEYSEYRSWNVNEDPQVIADTPIVIGDSPRQAFGKLFQRYEVKALLQQSTKDVFFVPRNAYARKTK